ncbi:MAG: FAD-binding oxidoreductase [Gammaproteobacteria bacterium]|nr:FAD-binding oxidoreductase [Gammaproteobacteria bacterium]
MKYDVVIIGGGIIGSAAAYFLGQAGNAGNIAVIEPDPTYALATTPQGAGGVRQLFSVTENIRMSQMSLAFYKAFDRDMAFDDFQPNIAFREQGYLFTVGTAGVDDLQRNHARQTALGVRTELLDVDALAARFPSIGRNDVAAACYSGDDGWIDPYAALQGFRKHAEHLGVAYINARVSGLSSDNDLVAAAILDNGDRVDGVMFINAAGPWVADIADMLGVDLPVQPMCRMQHYWLCDAEIEPLPLVKDESGMFFRPEGEGFAGGCPSVDIAPGFVSDFHRGFFANYFEEVVWPLVATRLPGFEAIKLQRSWGGHYAQNLLDGNMIIGRFSNRHNNIITACGFSGHGIMHAPAVGRALSELVLHERFETMDLSAFGIERVWNNQPLPENGIR